MKNKFISKAEREKLVNSNQWLEKLLFKELPERDPTPLSQVFIFRRELRPNGDVVFLPIRTNIENLPSGGGGGIIYALTAPSTAVEEEIWVNTTTLKQYVKYNDGTSVQWVLVGQTCGSGGGSSGGGGSGQIINCGGRTTGVGELIKCGNRF